MLTADMALYALHTLISTTGLLYQSATTTAESGGTSVGMRLVISLVIGIIVALVVVLVMNSKMKTVRSVDSASKYTREGSFRVTHSQDRFLYRHVTKRARPQNNNNNNNRR